MSRRSLLDRAPEYVFALAALVAPPLVVLAPLGMAVLMSVFGVMAGLTIWARDDLATLSRPILGFILLFAAWSLITLAWAPDPGHAAASLARVVTIGVAGLLALHMVERSDLQASRLVAAATGLGFALAILILAVEYLSGNRLTMLIMAWKGFPPFAYAAKSQLNRGATALIMMIWPLGLLAWRRRSPLLGAIALAAVVILAVSDSLATQLALASGCGIFLATVASARLGGWLLRAGLVALLVGFPLLAHLFPTPPETFARYPMLPLSANHRLAIWQFSGERLTQHPWRGWGMDASRNMPGGDDDMNIERRTPEGNLIVRIDGPRLPLHPHSAYLQWWLELGLVGQLILGAFLFRLVGTIQHSARWDGPGRAAAAASLTAGLVVSGVAYGIWQNWWLGCLWLAAALCLLVARRPVETRGCG